MVIEIKTDKPYEVIVEDGVLDRAGEKIAPLVRPGSRAMIVSETNVFPIYGERLKASLEKAGIHTAEFVFEAGEPQKQLSTVMQIYEALADVHVSGHACQEELKLIHVLTKPKFFIPVHGEARHLHQHARLAQELGMPEKNIRVPELGQVFELSRTGMNVAGTVPIGSIMIDGLGIGDVGNVVLRDRKLLSQDGLIIVVMAIDHELGQVTSGPDIISRGFVYVRESEEMMEGARLAAKSALDAFDTIDPGDWGAVKHKVREEVSHYIFGRIKRSPMILPIIIEV